MRVSWQAINPDYPQDSQECETYSAEIHERSGLYMLKLYDLVGSEKKLTRGIAQVVDFSVVRT